MPDAWMLCWRNQRRAATAPSVLDRRCLLPQLARRGCCRTNNRDPRPRIPETTAGTWVSAARGEEVKDPVGSTSTRIDASTLPRDGSHSIGLPEKELEVQRSTPSGHIPTAPLEDLRTTRLDESIEITSTLLGPMRWPMAATPPLDDAQ